MWVEVNTNPASTPPSILILGTRGVPAAHGGFETFAENLALFLVARGWHVGVYCQENVQEVRQRIRSENWRGIERICVQVASRGSRATLEFDWHCVRDAGARARVPCLVLGYNGAVFLPYLRLKGRKIVTNMDGIEWRRPKWSLPVKTWFWINEWIAAWSSNRMIADHPLIADHLATRRARSMSVTIPYGGIPVCQAPEEPVRALGLEPDRYFVSIARIEPDNNILPIVKAFSRKRRDAKLVVLGGLNDSIAYHLQIRSEASAEVVFPGAIYDPAIVQALRFHARAYIHGHTVGGTNPSLVEALWAGNAVIAHDNPYNRWTAGEAAVFFADMDGCEVWMEAMLKNDALIGGCRAAARARAQDAFRWSDVLSAYERVFLELGAAPASTTPRPAPGTADDP